MPIRLTKEQKCQCIALRTEHNLSAPAIARQLKISNHSAYKILKNYPWKPAPKLATRGIAWTAFDIGRLRAVYPHMDRAEIVAQFPGRNWATISRKACDMNIRRPQPGSRNNKRVVLALFKQLRAERERQNLRRPDIAARCGYHHNQILAWELGKAIPKVNYFLDWAQSLGFEVVLRPTAQTLLAERPAPPNKFKMMAAR